MRLAIDEIDAQVKKLSRERERTVRIEDDIPEIAQAKRLGHRLPGVRGIYSHVTPAMIQRIVDALQRLCCIKRSSRSMAAGLSERSKLTGGFWRSQSGQS